MIADRLALSGAPAEVVQTLCGEVLQFALTGVQGSLRRQRRGQDH